jgi:hypothetical protein
MPARTSARRRAPSRRLAAGDVIAPRELAVLGGEAVSIPDPDQLLHLQLRRFVGCPICNLHLRTFTQHHEEIADAGIREVVVFHSTAEEMARYAPEVPFALVADPERRLYTELGVEPALRSLLHPGAWGAVLRGPLGAMRTAEPTPLRPTGGHFGLPGDFLIAPDGRLVACHYGTHAYDQWSVPELLELAASTRR